MNEQKLYLYGASGHGKVVAEIAEAVGVTIAGFIDANPAITTLLDYSVTTKLPAGNHSYVISIGNNRIRKKLAGELGDCFATLIHPAAVISSRATLGHGSVVMGGSTINSSTQIGKHGIINTNASIDHDCHIGDFVHISPNVALAGNVLVGEGTHIGIGACVIQGVRIGRWCTIGAGAVIIRDVPDGATIVGNPGRIIKVDNTISGK